MLQCLTNHIDVPLCEPWLYQRRGGLRVKRHLRFWSRGEAYAMPMRGDAV